MTALPDRLKLAYQTYTELETLGLPDLEKAFEGMSGIYFTSENERQKLAIVLQAIEDLEE